MPDPRTDSPPLLATAPAVAHPPFFPDCVCDEDGHWWVRRDLAPIAERVVPHVEECLAVEGHVVMVPCEDPFDGGIGGLTEADPELEHDEAAVYVHFEDRLHDWYLPADRDEDICLACGATA